MPDQIITPDHLNFEDHKGVLRRKETREEKLTRLRKAFIEIWRENDEYIASLGPGRTQVNGAAYGRYEDLKILESK